MERYLIRKIRKEMIFEKIKVHEKNLFSIGKKWKDKISVKVKKRRFSKKIEYTKRTHDDISVKSEKK